ncbi:polyhydroxyalkanoate synthase [Oryzisolibacter propanilivorax]|uniref:Polyhydroxyalkanoate synthase n=1 Tax=Oryzisolibacter propanilivorax TaxID=1527607 RepID=A0A1G9PJJ8_9BURK|nr:class I poly(R)-hydroxyalkanoic acid synthase [Oryzisolibacter propanilivorax]SDL98305.1 polyhydroxyalkanoate synthase [Oryzisolibacter propanilivorax]
MNSDAGWAESARQWQEMIGDGWSRMMATLQPPDLGSLSAAVRPQPPVNFDPEKLAQLQEQYLQDARALWTQGPAALASDKPDRRFAGESWAHNPLSAYAAALYQLQSRTFNGLVDAMLADDKTRARIRFAVDQWLAAMAPSNFLALNPEAQQKALETQGESIAKGMANLLRDMRQGRISMTDESGFQVGRNVASSEGAVVFENELFQLLEFKPLTPKVHERPFLMVPPCINKYYILDLQPANSLIRYAVSQGHRTFVVSWRNPDESLASKTWDDYIEGAVLRAIETVGNIAGSEQINALGFCVGGTMLANALAVLAARGEDPVASATFLTTLLDFRDPGILDVFIDENFVRLRELQMGKGGLMKGQDMASTFSFLRPNDLVWNYVVGNYLKGETPPAFDLLYWNGDATNLPGPFYASYLRNFYLENRLVRPGALTVCGEKLDLNRVRLPVYVYGSREDHIVPIDAAYASTQVLPGNKRFVAGASGHIAGVINPPAARKRSHWVRDDGQFPASFDAWLESATQVPGSWWDDWAGWLASHAGKQIAAPKAYGRGKAYQAIEPAPGRYVLQKA